MSAFVHGQLHSDLGALQIMPSPVLSDAVPLGPWMHDQAGYAYIEEVLGNTLPAGASIVDGMAFSSAGALLVTFELPIGTDNRPGGWRARGDGVMCLTSDTPTSSTAFYVGGGAYNTNGQRFVGNASLFAANYVAGSIVPRTGQAPTFTRATTATVVDQDLVVRSVLSSEARFQGLRRVQNRVLGHSNNLSNGSYGVAATGVGIAAVVTGNFGAAPDGSLTASRLQLSLGGGNATTDRSYVQNLGLGATAGVLASCYVKTNDGSVKVIGINTGLGGGDSESSVTVDGNWRRVVAATPSITLEGFRLGLRGGLGMASTADLLVWGVQLESVVGQAVQVPGDIVSVGVLASPYHGANVDGVKYFPTHNGNVIQQNVLQQSQTFDNAYWTKRGAVTATPAATTAPDGTLTGQLISNLGVVGVNDMFNSNYNTALFAANTPYTPSVYIKRVSTIGTLLLQNPVSTAFGNWSVNFALLSDGWERLTPIHPAVTVTTPSTANSLGNGGVMLNTNTGPLSFYLWGAQAQPGRRAGTYVPTVAAAVNNNIVEEALGDPISTSVALGYLSEGARTNVALQSEDFATTWAANSTAVSVNATVGPDGLSTADKITELAAVSEHYENQPALNIAASQPIVCTVYAKAAERNFLYLSAIDRDAATSRGAHFNLATGAIVSTEATVTSAITPLGNGWYRCSISYTLTAGATAPQMRVQVTADGATKSYLGVVNSGIYVWGAQAEQALFASSYIPTVAATVARNADLLNYSGAFTAAGVGSWLAQFQSIGASSGNARIISYTTSKTPITHGAAALPTPMTSYDTITAANTANTVAVNTTAKVASGYTDSNGSRRITLNGGAVGAAVSGGTFGTPATVVISQDGTIAADNTQHYGVMAKAQYYPRHLSDAQLQAIST